MGGLDIQIPGDNSLTPNSFIYPITQSVGP